MAGLLADPVIEKLSKLCSDYLQDQVGWQTGMKPEVRRLQENLIKIKAVVAASNQVQITGQNQDFMDWRWLLRDAIDEADDLLDDFEYMKHKEQMIRRNMVETKNPYDATRFLLEGARRVGRRALKIDRNLKRLKEVVQKLDKVSTDSGTFLHLVQNIKKEQQEQQLKLFNARETGCLPKNDLVGRRENVESVMEWLRKASNEDPTHSTGSRLYNNISLLSIVGDGGMGKTTLLQHVYKDLKDEFMPKMWACVSTDSDARKVISSMLDGSESRSLDVLQRNLKSKVQDNKFLLVLDDIWEEEDGWDQNKWENVLSPLAHGSLGSKILITTRMDSVASMMANVIGKKVNKLKLGGLEEDKCLELLNTHAFANVDNLDDHKSLKLMTREIVKKLLGSPLAAKVIGGVLNSDLKETHWTNVLNSDIWRADLGPSNLIPILRLSYTFLPKHLQNCFAFCGIFPEDHVFQKNDLVRMWISLGFIEAPSISRDPTLAETMEDIGGKYFDTLVNKSFFDKVHDSEIYYKVHDLLHQLAQSISENECFRFVGDKYKPFTIPETTRHLFVDSKDIEVFRKIKNLKNLHSLFLTSWREDQEYIYILTDIFKTSRNIRLLSIHFYRLKVLPKAIGYLTHLRYLNFNFYTIEAGHLPRSLSSLYHLQFIIIKSYGEDQGMLPRDMNNLTNLSYLNITPQKAFSSIPGIGKLKSLQELNGFYIKDENGFRIGELEHMNLLRLLNINDLHDLRDAEEAHSAKLNDKIYLTDLSLNFSKTTILMESDWDEAPKILENLRPPKNLQKLSIISYTGAKSAIWMDDAELISNLKEIELKDCLFLETLPPFEQIPFLKYLYLINMPKVKRFNDKFCVFPSLERLHIYALTALEDWFDAAGAIEDECLFPCLTELYLKDCSNLHELPILPPKLEELEIYNVGWKALNWNQGISSISKSIPLKTLKLVGCPNLTSLPLADETVRLEALRYLKIQDCPNLISLGGLQDVETNENFKIILSNLTISDPSVLLMEPLRSNASIEKLKFTSNDELESFASEARKWFMQVSSSLQEMRIAHFKSLQSLPSSFESFSSLKTLELNDVPQLQVLPNIPASLENLRLYRLESLQCSFLSTLHNSSLKVLLLSRIPLLKSLPDLPRSLCDLDISGLEKLDCLPSSIASLSSLRDLTINNLPQLRELPDLPRSLCWLYISDLDKIDCLPSSIARLSSLRHLSIENVPQLRELPDLPPSLEYLTIEDCHPELKKRYKKPSGSDLHKFAHIPDLEIRFFGEMNDEMALTCTSLLRFLISKIRSICIRRWGR